MKNPEKEKFKPVQDFEAAFSDSIGRYLAEQGFEMRVDILSIDKKELDHLLNTIGEYCQTIQHNYDGTQEISNYKNEIDKIRFILLQVKGTEDLMSEDLVTLERILEIAGIRVD